MQELFATCGKLVSHKVHYDNRCAALAGGGGGVHGMGAHAELGVGTHVRSPSAGRVLGSGLCVTPSRLTSTAPLLPALRASVQRPV